MNSTSGWDEEQAAVLDAAMTAVSVRDDAATRTRLFELLLAATVAVATPETGQSGHTGQSGPRSLRAGEQVTFVTAGGEDGAVVLPVFTRLDALRNWTGNDALAFLFLPLATLFEMASQDADTTVWINPGEPVSGYVTPHEIRDLARGRLPHGNTATVAEERPVTISPLPELPPRALLDTVTGPFARRPEIDRAWGFFMRQQGLDAETVVGVGFVPGTGHETVRAAMRGIVDEACTAAPANKAIAFIAADEGLRATLADGAGLELYRAHLPAGG